MRILLQYWPRTWQSASFDVERGVGRVRWLRRAPAVTCGWASKRWGRWYAVWTDGDSLVFQVAKQRFTLDNRCRCTNVRDGSTRTFTMFRDDEPVFERRYRAQDRDWDRTFDSLDLELEDFFVWTTQLCNDPSWQADFIRNGRTRDPS